LAEIDSLLPWCFACYADCVTGDSKSLASLAQGIREQTEGTPEREAKLAELAARIGNGEYQVDPEKLADSLLRQIGPVKSESED
jgi:anti-sigma28 factor (negative regulator of flagellin synthesis)